MADTEKIETVKDYGVTPLWPRITPPDDNSLMGVEIGGEKYVLTRADAVQFATWIYDVAGVKVVPK